MMSPTLDITRWHRARLLTVQLLARARLLALRFSGLCYQAMHLRSR